jgi:tetratricopeptide (TPR) repeat protein
MNEGNARWRSDSRRPYPGTRSFTSPEADRFYGRDAESAAVRGLWLHNRLSVLHGPAAIGKTSLVTAGTLPLLNAPADNLSAFEVLPLAQLRPPREPAPDAAIDRNPSSYSVLQAWTGTASTSIRAASMLEYLLSRQRVATLGGERPKLLAAIDDFDWIFDTPEYERDAFTADLADALRSVPDFHLLLIVGDDSLPQFQHLSARLTPIPAAYYHLQGLAPANAAEAACRPMVGTGHEFTENTAEQFVAAISSVSWLESGCVHPLLLQLACDQLWSRLTPSDVAITPQLLEQVSDLDLALRRFYDAVIDGAHSVTGTESNKLRAWIEYAFISDDGEPKTTTREAGLFAGMPHRFVDLLADSHFLAIERPAQRTAARLTLDVLASAVVQVNQMRRSVAAPGALSYEPAAIVPGMYATAARDAFAEGNLADAQELAVMAAEQYQQDGEERLLAHTLVLRGDIARARGDLGHAEEDFQAALTRFSVLEDRDQTARTLSALGGIRAMEGNYHHAEEYQRLAVDTQPSDVDALVALGYAQWHGGSPANAEATFTQALDVDANATLAVAGRGQVRAEIREYGAALVDLDQALAAGLAASGEAEVRSARALALAGLGRTQEANAEIEAARRTAPTARTVFRSARVAGVAGRVEAAIGDLERALAGRPPLSPAEQEAARRMLGRLTADQRRGDDRP